MSRKTSTAYVWFDTEFTSLDLDEAKLLQISVMLTDKDLQRLTPPEEDVCLYLRLEETVPVSPWVEKNLPELVRKCRSATAVTLPEADARLAALLDRWCGTPTKTVQKRPILAGNSVHTDWALARRYLPQFTERLHYRLLDVSALKIQWLDLTGGEEFQKDEPTLVKKWFPQADLRRLRRHDAYYDIIASAAELAYYRATFLMRPPETRPPADLHPA
jgi:oligoribonuclease